MALDRDGLVAALEGAQLGRFQVVLMPDFSLDHLIQFRDMEETAQALRDAAALSNTELAPQRQMLRPGGGAANTAHALARLGVRARLIVATSPAGVAFLQATLGRDGVDLSRVRDDGRLDVTGALECPGCSVMLFTPRPHGGIAPESLVDEDWDVIAKADAVFVGDWWSPRTPDLAAQAWRVARGANARTYTDPGVPPDGEEARAQRLAFLASADLDAVSLNDSELRGFEPGHEEGVHGLLDAGASLSRRLHARVDLHSDALTASFRQGRLEGAAPRFAARARQATGAGDTWNAGAIVGDLLGLGADERLLLSNALVAHYVSSERVEPPTRDQAVAWVREGRLEGEDAARSAVASWRAE